MEKIIRITGDGRSKPFMSSNYVAAVAAAALVNSEYSNYKQNINGSTKRSNESNYKNDMNESDIILKKQKLNFDESDVVMNQVVMNQIFCLFYIFKNNLY
eukprot:c11985_g1_i1.p1 GENE.c11985_g1_i1~~c11985_g1_i1.p1  ORF type:complete len:100 (-),score=20.04 c11985_g1_i1:187-486(-)